MESGRGAVWRVGVGVYGEGACRGMESGESGMEWARDVWRVGEGVYGEWASGCMESGRGGVWKVG